MSSRHVLELGPDDWNSPLDDHLFIVADTHTDPAIVAFRRAITNPELDEPADPEAVRRWLDHAQRAADLTVDLLDHLVEVLRADHPGPADRVLKLADSLAAHADSLSEAIYRHAVASRFAAKLEGSEAVDRAAADVLLDIQAAYICETEAVSVADLTPAWWADYPFRPAGERAGVFSRYREYLHGLFAGDPPDDWDSAVTVRLATAAAQTPAPVERLRRGLHNERVAFGTLGATPALSEQIATAVAVAPPARAKRNSHLGNVARSEAAREILAHLAATGIAREGLEIANAVGQPYDSVRHHLAAFVRTGMVTKPSGGGYAITAAGRAAVAPGSGV